ncbi:MAG: hotdog fold thioesterase [Lentisphaeria bacterium]|nr:MAG: hotdog fold thioesterase [Lentisphaeria bacterium]
MRRSRTISPLEAKLPEPEVPDRFQIRIRPTMEDVNGHLNNAEYAGLVQDCATEPGEGSPRFCEVELHFLSAVRAPELLTVGGIRMGSTFLCCGRNEAGQLSFNAAAELQ